MFFVSGRVATTIVAVALLSACHKHTANGQVLAVVNGNDVTRREFAADLAAANLPGNTDLKAIEPEVMSDLVNRKLLVEQAKQQGLDKNPDYLAAAARAQEVVLAQQLISAWVSRIPAATSDDAQVFIGANPQMFANRQIYQLDQIETSSKELDSKALAPLHSMDAIIDYLRQHNHAFRRGTASLDTLALPADAAQKIAQLAPGEPFVNGRGDALEISAVVQTKPEPVPDEQRNAIALQALKQRAAQKAIADHLNSLRASATISYQPGFAPVKPGGPS